MRVGLERKLSTEELMLLNLALEKTLDSPLDFKEIKPVHPKGNQSWIFIGRTDTESEAPVLWTPDAKTPQKWPWCWEGLRAGREGNNKGWHGWMASPTQWTWVWTSSRNWGGTGKPGMQQFLGLQRVRQEWATQLNWTDSKCWKEKNSRTKNTLSSKVII